MTDLEEFYVRPQIEALVRSHEQFMLSMPVTLYDQFGRPVYVPSTQRKIGDTITVRRPERFGK